MDVPCTIGKYQVVRELGRGGFGRVFLCRHPGLDQLRALKLLDQPAGHEGRAAEALLQARLRHENIVEVLDLEEVGGRPCLVMEYMPGGSLRDTLSAGSLALDRVLSLARDLAAALEFAYGQGVIHRDLKPANVLLTKDGRAKVADFGLARILDDRPAHHSKVAGTVAYLAPEQLRGEASPQSDLWALGCMIHEMLAGEPPFGSGDDFDTMKAIAEQDPPALYERFPDLPSGLARLMVRLLAKDPSQRPASAQEVLEKLSRVEAESRRPVDQAHTMADHDWACFRSDHGRTGAVEPALRLPLEEAWHYVTGAPVLSSPAICRGRVFLGDNRGNIHAVDLLSGQRMWRFQTKGPVYSSPAAAGTALLAATAEGWVYALDSANGDLLWQRDLEAQLIASPALTAQGVLIADAHGSLRLLDPVDGGIVASASQGESMEATPLWHDGSVFTADMEGRVIARDQGLGESWSYEMGGPVEASPAWHGGRLLVLGQGGELLYLDALTGNTAWRRELDAMCCATPAAGDGAVVVCAMAGRVWCLEVGTGEKSWVVDLGTAFTASPCVAGGLVVVAGRDGSLRLLDSRDGRDLQRLDLAAPIHSSPAVWHDLVVAADMDGNVMAFAPAK